VEVLSCFSIFRRLSFPIFYFSESHSGMALALMHGMEEGSLTKGPWIWIVFFPLFSRSF
jgi:hypothetical protein